MRRSSPGAADERDAGFVVRRVAGRRVTAVEACSAHSFARHTHDEYGIGVMIAGAQRSWSGRGAVEAVAGDLITVNPGETHDGAPVAASRAWAMLYLDCGTLAAIVSDIGEGGLRCLEFVDPGSSDRRAAGRFAATYAALIAGDDDAADERLMLTVAGLLDVAAPPPVMPLRLLHVRARIDDDPLARHSLDELAREAGASRFQTLRGFARLTGLTPHGYVVQRRLEIARALIRGGAGLADAASAAGFADQSHFHRCFRRRYGFTPGVYAAAMR
jgi:AraC-like DNA-binding protein/quercetin dioxygenase-like cupin family protein